jgi:hypothetical protein
MKFRLALAALATFAVAAPAQAQVVLGTNPQTVVQALQSAGYRAVLGRDEQGDPKIDTAAGGTNFVVYFFDCTSGRDCRAVQFHSSYETQPPSLETMNRWNRDYRYTRAFVTSANNPALEMDINLDAAGGISRRLFLDSLELYVGLLPQFERLIGWEP